MSIRLASAVAAAPATKSALTTFTKNGVEKTLKTGAVFLDLTAAYDTIWHTDLIYKLSKCLPLWCVQTVELLL